MRLWQKIANPITPKNALIGLTIMGLAALLVFIFRARKRTASAGRSPRFIIVITVFSLGLALCCSYNLLFEPCAASASAFGFLLNPFVRFLLNVLAVLLIILLIAVVTLGILDPWRIEVTAKLFGAEFSFKKKFEDSQESLAQVKEQAEQTEALLARIFQDWQDWSSLISRLNENVLESMDVSRLAINKEEAVEILSGIKSRLSNVLNRAYLPLPDSVAVHVLPLTGEEVVSLPSDMAAKVALALECGSRSAVIDGTGLAICRGKDGNGAVVILEGLDGYEVSPAEAAAAGILLTAALCGAA